MTDNTNIAERAQAHADVLRQYGTQQSGWVKVHTSDLVAYGEFLHQLSVALRSEEWQPIATAEEPQHSGRPILLYNREWWAPIGIGGWDEHEWAWRVAGHGCPATQPTHWRLLPAPPAIDAAMAAEGRDA